MAFGVILPGNLILKNLGLESEHFSTELIRSFFTGFALNILLYYMSAITGTYYVMFIIDPLLSLLWFVRTGKTGFGRAWQRFTGA